ncbi:MULTISPECIES: hypothetical protein [Psychrilyobacter]|uniref:Uncharacterized protein n=1 Tax=Psychrilyobacter piezotolerans TaxID=2293438 RepID=A0ABX9KIQ9_9FUSO|nr:MULTISPECIES: hypothetical protein [Psychrilyobacter]NDI77455.1 hypothetical protein [Psychrilyobacter piezotolerans]RDE63757.1 hypothetical protein DV867_05110 [Psychrilyobacter sp. S5]REI42101.1 hypothetical protein DYH56_05110 [Psychrilyobacter piezotolerans]
MDKIYWIFRIILYYTVYQNMEVFGNSIDFIITMVIIYYMPNMGFKFMGLIMDEIDSWTK